MMLLEQRLTATAAVAHVLEHGGKPEDVQGQMLQLIDEERKAYDNAQAAAHGLRNTEQWRRGQLTAAGNCLAALELLTTAVEFLKQDNTSKAAEVLRSVPRLREKKAVKARKERGAKATTASTGPEDPHASAYAKYKEYEREQEERRKMRDSNFRKWLKVNGHTAELEWLEEHQPVRLPVTTNTAGRPKTRPEVY